MALRYVLLPLVGKLNVVLEVRTEKSVHRFPGVFLGFRVNGLFSQHVHYFVTTLNETSLHEVPDTVDWCMPAECDWRVTS